MMFYYRFSRSGRPGIKGEGPGPGQYEGDVNKVSKISRMNLTPLRYFIRQIKWEKLIK
jgi:hypothetical protein